MLKEKSLILFFAVLAAMTPIHGMIITMTLTVFIETSLYIYATRKRSGWLLEQITAILEMLPKMVFYSSMIILAYLVNEHVLKFKILDINYPLSRLMTALFIASSIFKMDKINTKILKNESFLSLIGKAIFTFKTIKKQIEDDEPDENLKKDNK